jgi:hypothetical protein
MLHGTQWISISDSSSLRQVNFGVFCPSPPEVLSKIKPNDYVNNIPLSALCIGFCDNFENILARSLTSEKELIENFSCFVLKSNSMLTPKPYFY